jgi:hypothetical protein
MAQVFGTIRVTGHVSNGVARDLLAQLQAFTDACELEGVEVKGSVEMSGSEPEAAKPVEADEPLPFTELDFPSPHHKDSE